MPESAQEAMGLQTPQSVTWLGVILHECRGQRSIKAVARQLGISPRAYRLVELGCQRPQIRTCYRLAGFLSVSPEQVLALAGYNSPGNPSSAG